MFELEYDCLIFILHQRWIFLISQLYRTSKLKIIWSYLNDENIRANDTCYYHAKHCYMMFERNSVVLGKYARYHTVSFS